MTTRPSRRAFVAGAVGAYASIGLLTRPAGAAEFSYKLGSDLPASHPNVIALNDAAAKVTSDSGGRLEIKVYSDNVLGGNTQTLAQVRSGALEMVTMVDVITSNVVPVASISGVGFAFPNLRAAWDAIDGDFGKVLRGAIAGMGVYPFATAWDAGFKQISNNVHPVASPDDLKGLKIRTPPSQLSASLYKAFSATPVTIDNSEQYTALQTHLVDGADIVISSFETGKYYEVQKYFTVTNHSLVSYTLMANGDAWQRLPQALRDLTERTFNAAAKAQRAAEAKQNDAYLAGIAAHGVAVNQADVAPFRGALRRAGYYSYWQNQFGPKAWALLEKSTGPL